MIGATLKHWRHLRGMSQMDLALAAGASARHMSFLETGRAKPSLDMTLKLADALEMPLRNRNDLLIAAGFAPRFGNSDWDAPELDTVRAAAQLILDTHAPYPAIVLNGCFDVLAANDGAWALLGGKVLPMPNLVDLVFLPGPVRDAIANWEDVAQYLLHRLKLAVRLHGPQSAVANKLRKAMATPEARALALHPTAQMPDVLLPLVFVTPQGESRWFTTVTSFGASQDALAAEVTIEMFHPMP